MLQGYGFLSENAGFVDICNDHGIEFIGPKANQIRMMGDKSTARDTMKVSASESLLRVENGRVLSLFSGVFWLFHLNRFPNASVTLENTSTGLVDLSRRIANRRLFRRPETWKASFAFHLCSI